MHVVGRGVQDVGRAVYVLGCDDGLLVRVDLGEDVVG